MQNECQLLIFGASSTLRSPIFVLVWLVLSHLTHNRSEIVVSIDSNRAETRAWQICIYSCTCPDYFSVEWLGGESPGAGEVLRGAQAKVLQYYIITQYSSPVLINFVNTSHAELPAPALTQAACTLHWLIYRPSFVTIIELLSWGALTQANSASKHDWRAFPLDGSRVYFDNAYLLFSTTRTLWLIKIKYYLVPNQSYIHVQIINQERKSIWNYSSS